MSNWLNAWSEHLKSIISWINWSEELSAAVIITLMTNDENFDFFGSLIVDTCVFVQSHSQTTFIYHKQQQTTTYI